MPGDPRRRLDLPALLEGVEAAAPVDAVEVAAAELSAMVGAVDVEFLITDFSGDALVRLGRAGSAAGAREQGGESADRVPLAGTRYERVVRGQGLDVTRTDDGARVLAPVTNRGDVVGVLEMVLPDVPDAETLADVAAAAHTFGYVLIANRRYTDLFEWGQRTTSFSLAAEIQRRLLPASFTCEAGQFTLAGRLEPSATIAGDTFDYSLERDGLRLSITDAAGHGVSSSLLATLLVASLRNSRRRGADVAEQARQANDELAAHSDAGQFVTGQLVQVDLASSCAAIVNAGHPAPLRLRAGRVAEIDVAVDMPFGLQPGREFTVQPLALEPGDRLLFLTDGMFERNAENLDLDAALIDTADLHPRETVLELARAVRRATAGALHDDAAVLCLDWYGGPRRSRRATGGANRQLASPPKRSPNA